MNVRADELKDIHYVLVNADGLKLPVGGLVDSSTKVPLNVQRRFISGPATVDHIE